MEEELSRGKTPAHMKVNSKTAIFMGKEPISGLMVEHTQGSIIVTSWKVMGPLLGWMVESTRGST